MRRSALRLFGPLSLVLLVMGLLPSGSVGAAPRPIPPNYDASQRPGNEAEDAIAINPTDPQNVVAMATLSDAPAGIAVDVTFDGGETWNRRVTGKGGGNLGDICCDEQLAWDRFGNLWMVYLHNVDPGAPLAVSTDGGLTFHKVIEVQPTTPHGIGKPPESGSKRKPLLGNHFADQPSVAVGPNSVWVSFTSYPSGVVEAFGARVTGLGQWGEFTGVQHVPTAFGRGNYGDTEVGPDGQVMVIYQDQTSGQGGSHIYSALDPDGLGPKGFRVPELVARSRVGGFDYLPIQPHRSFDAEASLAWDRSGGPHTGRVYAIWVQEVKNESDNFDVMLQYSDDEGETWSRAVRLNDDGTRRSQGNPAPALDQTSGDLAISWYDARNDDGDGGPGDTDGVPNDDVQIWATYSTDGGATWAPNFRVSEGTSNARGANDSFDFGDYTQAAFHAGLFYPAWSDNSNSTGTNPDGRLNELDLYTARVVIP